MEFVNSNLEKIYDKKIHADRYITEQELDDLHQEMINKGFIPNKELDIFIVEGYGAWLGDLFDEVFFGDFFGSYVYQGAELIMGPTCYGKRGVGVFCKNYLEMIEKDKEKAKKY